MITKIYITFAWRFTMEHLVYCDKKAKVLDKIIIGTKTMIIRGAAGRKFPHSRVFAGETLYFITNDGSGLIKAKAVVKNAFSSEKMTEEESKSLVASNMDKLNLTEAQVERWAGKKYLVLVEIENVSPIEPLQLDHQKNMDDWLIIEKIEDILVGTSKDFEYVKIK